MGKWWIDADPSGLVWTGLDCDDDLALIGARALEAAGEMEVIGLSICGGNAPLRHTWPNALKLQQSIGVTWNVFKGAGWQKMQPAWASLRLLSRLIHEDESEDAVDAIIRTASTMRSQTLSVLMLGPATNLARALQRAPWLAGHLKSAVLMGGELTGRRLDLNFMLLAKIGSLQLSRSCRAAKDAFADLAHAKVGQPTRAFGSGRLARQHVFGCGFHTLGLCGSSCGCPTTFVHKVGIPGSDISDLFRRTLQRHYVISTC
eukprot:symbB.v1.2.038292.t1/scaffold5915.1/size22486/1